MLIAKSNMEFQETMNYWKQMSQIMKYFRAEEDTRADVPRDFMTSFLEVSLHSFKFIIVLGRVFI
jgi:NADH dehydrogenase (ubiquinone) 1 alpha subcomplex subunit 6